MESKSQRIKQALGRLRTIIQDKQIEIPSRQPSLFQFKEEQESIVYSLGPYALRYPSEKQTISLEQLAKTLDEAVDNTGNMKEWPSEQILALYILNNEKLQKEIAAAEHVSELGAGKSGLVGFLCAKIAPQTTVTISDGNTTCVKSKSQSQNIFRFGKSTQIES